MRSQNVFMLGVCGFVLAVIGYFLVIQKSPREVLKQWGLQQSSTPRMAAPDPDPATEPKKKETAPVRPRVPKSVPDSLAAVGPVVPSTPPAPPPPPAPQPALKDIRMGMERDELLRRYPSPALQTSTIRGGDLVELVVYHQSQDRRTATFAQLENGVVTQVYAGMAPTRALTR